MAVRNRFHGTKKINVYGHDAVDSGLDICPWPRVGLGKIF